MKRRLIETYVLKFSPAPEHTRPSLYNIRKEKSMFADNEFLIGLSNQLLELADKTTDTNTEEELRNLAEMTIKTCV